MLHGEVVQQLDVARLESEVHPQQVTACQGIEDGQGLPLLGSHPGDIGMPLSQVIISPGVIY